MFTGSELEAETESPKSYLFLVSSITSSAVEGVGSGEMFRRRTNRTSLTVRISVSSNQYSAYGHGEPMYTGHKSFVVFVPDHVLRGWV